MTEYVVTVNLSFLCVKIIYNKTKLFMLFLFSPISINILDTEKYSSKIKFSN